MGIFNKFFEKKNCDVCGRPIDHFTNTKIRDGNCCKACISRLSPWFTNYKSANVKSIKDQITYRAQMQNNSHNFYPSVEFQCSCILQIDENNSQFVLKRTYHDQNLDYINCKDITNCDIDIKEHREEIKFMDSNDEIRSFTPSYYAYSYDIFIEIYTNIFYIPFIRFKVNPEIIKKHDDDVVDYSQDGLWNKIKDKINTERSFNGKTSNKDEVLFSPEYIKYSGYANDIRNILLFQKNANIRDEWYKNSLVSCPWCDSQVPGNIRFCDRCGGALNEKELQARGVDKP